LFAVSSAADDVHLAVHYSGIVVVAWRGGIGGGLVLPPVGVQVVALQLIVNDRAVQRTAAEHAQLVVHGHHAVVDARAGPGVLGNDRGLGIGLGIVTLSIGDLVPHFGHT